MKNILIIILVAVLILMSVGLYLALKKRTEAVVQPQPQQSPLPQSPIFPASSTPHSNVQVSTKDNANISVRNFLIDATTLETPTPDTYSLAGHFDTPESDPAFSITYVEFDKSFTVSLWKEPLGEMRRRAEAELRARLGVDDATLCRLRVAVLVPYWVNESYAIGDLGMSFCPGSVPLTE